MESSRTSLLKLNDDNTLDDSDGADIEIPISSQDIKLVK